ncbi:metallophosphatase family protein [Aquincola tertiaricarbonis]|uniref:Metallophosphatase family protein n=1 Tax=Aquincola tertiaricarbonis TaxID=391953 RepID=A0ABY4SBB3_AQUTE|nr:metallophosphoesterase family protein [Aquincola tertiaricarbonis]URI10288.1 metallophosphatase family protein [Aquincola tertiaricarbonis]
MRIALVSDIHGNLPALEAVIAEIADAGADLVVNLGDIVSGPLWPQETARRLMALGWPTIAGNHERQLLTQAADRMGASDAFAAAALGAAERAWLAALPATLTLPLPARGQLVCVHGTPASDLQYLLETTTPGLGVQGHTGIRAATAAELHARLGPVRPPLLACGHSHVPRVVAQGGTLVVNPGSVGLQAYDDLHPPGSGRDSHWVENGSPLARWALLVHGPAGWRAELRHTPYDVEAAARRAEANGRGDWADALRTGRVGRTEADLP